MMRHVHTAGQRFAYALLSVLGIGCALLLIALSLNGRTDWAESVTASSPNAATMRDAAGWDWVARGAGGLAVICLGVGLYTQRRWLAIAVTTVASVCLAWAAYVAWQFSTDIAQGLMERAGWTVRTPEHVGHAALAAATAGGIAFVLLLTILSSLAVAKRTTRTLQARWDVVPTGVQNDE